MSYNEKELIGNNVIVSRKLPKIRGSNLFCPGIVTDINDTNVIIQFGDNEKLTYLRNKVKINNPFNIKEKEKYNNYKTIVYSPNSQVLANIDYKSGLNNYSHGVIKKFNINNDSCDITFNDYGLITDIPVKHIITKCDNRFFIFKKEKKMKEEEKNIEEEIFEERNCDIIKNIENVRKKKNNNNNNNNNNNQIEDFIGNFSLTNPNFKYLIIMNIFTLIFGGVFLLLNFNLIYKLYYENITSYKYINYIVLIFIWILIAFSIGPIYLIIGFITYLLDLFSFNINFSFIYYLLGKPLFTQSIYIFLLILFSGSYIIFTIQNFLAENIITKKIKLLK